MHNLLTGVCLLALGALAVAVLLFHQFAPPIAPETPPSLESDPLDEEDASAVAVVGRETNPPPSATDAPPTAEEEMEKLRKAVEGDPSTIVKPPDKNGVITVRVVRGDTLSSLARFHLGDATLWPAILEANPDLLRAEDLREGQEIKIPLREGR